MAVVPSTAIGLLKLIHCLLFTPYNSTPSLPPAQVPALSPGVAQLGADAAKCWLACRVGLYWDVCQVPGVLQVPTLLAHMKL